MWGSGLFHDFYLWDVLKHKECSNNPHAEYSLKESIQNTVFFSFQLHAESNAFVMCDAYLQAK